MTLSRHSALTDVRVLFCLPVAGVAFALVSALGTGPSLIVAVLVVLAPLLVLIDGAPLLFLMAALPGATLLTDTAAGLGGTKILAVFTLACLFAGLLLGRQTLHFKFCALDVAVIGLFAIALANILVLSSPATGQLSLLQEYGGNLMLYLVVRAMVFSSQRLKRLLVAFVAGAVIAAIVGLYRYSHGLVGLSENLHRLVIPNQNINSFASVMLLAAAISFAFAFYDVNVTRRTLWAITGFMSAAAMVLTFSRGAFVGAVCMLAAAIILSRGTRLRVAAAVVMIGAIAAAQTSLPEALGLSGYVTRVQAILSFNYQATSGRNILWAMGWDAFLQHPVLGLGIGNFLLPRYWYPLLFRQYGVPLGFSHEIQAVHNFYIGWAADAGIVGLVFLGSAVVIAFAYIVRALNVARSNTDFQTPAHALLLAFVGYFIFIISSPVQYYQLPYILLGLVGSLGFIASSCARSWTMEPAEAFVEPDPPSNVSRRLEPNALAGTAP